LKTSDTLEIVQFDTAAIACSFIFTLLKGIVPITSDALFIVWLCVCLIVRILKSQLIVGEKIS
jgi:hypothetical protein